MQTLRFATLGALLAGCAEPALVDEGPRPLTTGFETGIEIGWACGSHYYSGYTADESVRIFMALPDEGTTFPADREDDFLRVSTGRNLLVDEDDNPCDDVIAVEASSPQEVRDFVYGAVQGTVQWHRSDGALAVSVEGLVLRPSCDFWPPCEPEYIEGVPDVRVNSFTFPALPVF